MNHEDSSSKIQEIIKSEENSKPNNAEYECYLCSKPHRLRSDLRQHIFCHLRHEIQAKFYPDVEQVKVCIECNYKSNIGEHVVMHLALKHQKLADFVPPEVAQVLYSKKGGKISPKKLKKKNGSQNSGKKVSCVR